MGIETRGVQFGGSSFFSGLFTLLSITQFLVAFILLLASWMHAADAMVIRLQVATLIYSHMFLSVIFLVTVLVGHVGYVTDDLRLLNGAFSFTLNALLVLILFAVISLVSDLDEGHVIKPSLQPLLLDWFQLSRTEFVNLTKDEMFRSKFVEQVMAMEKCCGIRDIESIGIPLPVECAARSSCITAATNNYKSDRQYLQYTSGVLVLTSVFYLLSLHGLARDLDYEEVDQLIPLRSRDTFLSIGSVAGWSSSDTSGSDSLPERSASQKQETSTSAIMQQIQLSDSVGYRQ